MFMFAMAGQTAGLNELVTKSILGKCRALLHLIFNKNIWRINLVLKHFYLFPPESRALIDHLCSQIRHS